jgi:hypothetical protein
VRSQSCTQTDQIEGTQRSREAGSKGSEQRQAAEAEELAASTTESTGWRGRQQCPSLLAVGGLAGAVHARRQWYSSAAALQDQQDMPHSVYT